jgi:hypothetical protein
MSTETNSTGTNIVTNTSNNISANITPVAINEPIKKIENTTNSDDSLYSYVFMGVLAVVLIMLLYYAYNRFVENSINEPFTEGTEQERDDPVDDFNLREAIKELQAIQKRVLSTLSETSSY